MAEMIVGLSKSNAEMRTTLRYLDQIQRSTERLGRVRYQSLIKTNNELRTTGRRLEHVYSTAIRLSRLRITPTIGLNDQLSPALDRVLAKLNRVQGQMVKASGTVSVEVRQKVEVAMGKMNPASGSSMSVTIGSHNTTVNNLAKEEEKNGFEKGWELTTSILDAANNLTDLFGKGKGAWDKKFKKDKSPKGKSQTRTTSRTGNANPTSVPSRKVSGGRRGRSYQNSTPAPAPTSPKIHKDVSPKGIREALSTNKLYKMMRGGGKSGFSSGILSGSPMGMPNLLSGNGMFSKLSGGLAKGAGKLLGPISMLADVANVASAPAGERGRAVGSMIGGTAGTAIGSAIGSVILPGIGTYVGGAIGGWAGSAAGEWIGGKAKDIGNFMSSATESVGNAVSGAVDYVAEKTKNITSGISNFFGFGSKEEEKVPPAPVPPAPSVQPAIAPPYIPSGLLTTGPLAYMTSMGVQPTSAAFQGSSMMQLQAMNAGNGSQSTAGTNGKSSPMTVQISEDQMSSLSSYLKDFKTETTNQIAVNVPVGAVQVTVRENAIDYDGLARQVGQRVVSEVRRAMENRKTIMA
ncbi:hypothetical protein ASD24_23100 [Paenibacillus sp. Root52]|uniref:glycine zipper family protein n=1 Tax=Paenibacillus sp. Root52 TaxID=1736552 RepID=UPI0006FA2186|nr:glycine zipper family protein [Paenibacillus sp. Root52]KQY91626.1 hypothetical protein ASD24_23100 [Paenibacillus sp. Root52]